MKRKMVFMFSIVYNLLLDRRFDVNRKQAYLSNRPFELRRRGPDRDYAGQAVGTLVSLGYSSELPFTGRQIGFAQ